MDDKQELRKQLRSQARLLGNQAFGDEDMHSCQALLQTSRYLHAFRVFAYAPLSGEVDISTLLAHETDRKRLALPVSGEDGTLTFFAVESLASLTIGRYNIPEPQKELEVVPTEKDIILVPALAYTTRGERLGRGKGYYDRYLACHPAVFSIGLCRSHQLLDHLPTDPWDCKVDTVLCAGIFY